LLLLFGVYQFPYSLNSLAFLSLFICAAEGGMVKGVKRRSNPELHRSGDELDCFAALAMTKNDVAVR
jgi:hypothetical protein